MGIYQGIEPASLDSSVRRQLMRSLELSLEGTI
jgi:hypothetical protein